IMCRARSAVGLDHTAAPDGPQNWTPDGPLRVGCGACRMVYDFQTNLPLTLSSAATLPRNVQQGYFGSAAAPSSPEEIGTYRRDPTSRGDPVIRAAMCDSG